MPHVFRIRRGLEEDIPILAPGEPALTTDTKKFFIGTVDGNVSTFPPSAHTHDYEPANANIQNHISSTSNPHSVTAVQVGAEPANANIQNHITATNNPHDVTCEQIGAADTSHLHDDRYLTETEADARFAPILHASHMSPIVAAMIFGGGE